MEHKIIVELNEKYNFNKITCTEGHHITSWNEGDDIKDYTSTTLIFAPVSVDISQFHCISDEEDNRLMELQRVTLEEEMKKHNEEMKGGE